jgi:peptidyl-prolyl cis-trans isomerase-like 1
MVESVGAPLVSVETTIGTFTVELYYKHAPKTCKNFLELSKKGYYNNVVVSPGLADVLATCDR